MTPPVLDFDSPRRLHAVGVAGMGLGPLALYLARLGHHVSGEDAALDGPMLPHLRRGGVSLLPSGQLPPDLDAIVLSSAIPSSHPTFAAARAAGLPVFRRGHLLAALAARRHLVALCGSHGKTSTTAFLLTALRAARFPVDYVLGGLFADDALPPADASPEASWLVAEIDESDGTIDAFHPALTVLVNLDWDHPDHYPSFDALLDTFLGLFRRTTGPLLTPSDCPFAAHAPPHRKTFGPAPATFPLLAHHEENLRLHLTLGGAFPLPQTEVRAWGTFNARNATAALAAAHLMGAPLSSTSLAAYPGVRRRQTRLPAGDSFVVLEDYAHHPAEISALLAALRPHVSGRLHAVFQPHRHSRTAQFRADFARALTLADQIHLLPVYSAGEPPCPGGSSDDLLASFPPTAPVALFADSALLPALDAAVSPGDTIIFIGAGNLDHLARTYASQHLWRDHTRALQAVLSPATSLRADEPLARKTTLGLGGPARLYAEPASFDDLAALLRVAHARLLPFMPLGRGSNLVIPDSGVDALVLSLRHPAFATFEPLPDGRIRVGAGLRLKELTGKAAAAGLSGFEFLEGIPGNLGGALRMNAGAMGGWIFDHVDHVEAFLPDGSPISWPRSALHVDYRHCSELQQAIAVAATLRPSSSAPSDSVSRQIDVYRDTRKKSQPREPSAGCIFKNPPGDSAGRLIDAAGLKGTRIGDAEVSPLHANFIINRGHATSADLIALVRHIRTQVAATHHVTLEPEVILYGQSWPDHL